MVLFLLAVYMGLAVLYLVFALLGAHQCFEGTFVARIHYCLTDGLCDGMEWVDSAPVFLLQAVQCRRPCSFFSS